MKLRVPFALKVLLPLTLRSRVYYRLSPLSMTENERTFVPRQKFYVALPYNITIVIRWVSQNTITPTRVIALSLHLHGVNLSPPTHTTRATNSSHSTITQRTLKKASDLIYVEDTRSTRVFPGLHGIEPLSGIEVYTMDTDFST